MTDVSWLQLAFNVTVISCFLKKQVIITQLVFLKYDYASALVKCVAIVCYVTFAVAITRTMLRALKASVCGWSLVSITRRLLPLVQSSTSRLHLGPRCRYCNQQSRAEWCHSSLINTQKWPSVIVSHWKTVNIRWRPMTHQDRGIAGIWPVANGCHCMT